jgi:hypothetical protein
VSALLEVKGCWNPGVRNDMREQLRDRYMRNSTCHCGLYIVGWYLCEKWDDQDGRKARVPRWSINEAQRFFKEQAEELSGEGLTLHAIILNLTLDQA